MEVMIREYGATIVRNALLPLISLLVAAGYATEEQASQFALAAAPIVVAVVWGLLNKYYWKKAAERALEHPPTTSEKTLQNVIAGK